MTKNFSAEIIAAIDLAHALQKEASERWRADDKCPWRRKSAEVSAAHDAERALQREAAEAFAALNGWRLSPSYFGTHTLAKGGVHSRVGYLNGRDPLDPHCLFDHPVHFRELKRPYRTIAIVGQPYGTPIEDAQRIAAALGLGLHTPPNLTASWWLGKARGSLQTPSDGDNFGAWAEVLAFSLAGSSAQASPWGTFFGPMGSATDKDGNTVYFPDIADADARVIAHWTGRAKTVRHPVLKARYADLVWDLCTTIAAGSRRDPELARLAIDGYVASVSITVLPGLHERCGAALRALDLAVTIRDEERKERVRTALLQVHQEALIEPNGPWWLTFDCLMNVRHVNVTDEERQNLVAGVEELVLRFGDITKPENFNPHAAQSAAKRLINYYARLQRPDDVKRLHEAIARAFEHFSGLGDAMLASTVLQTAVNAYRDAGLSETAGVSAWRWKKRSVSPEVNCRRSGARSKFPGRSWNSLFAPS